MSNPALQLGMQYHQAGRFTEAVTRFALSPAPVPVTPSHSRKDPS